MEIEIAAMSMNDYAEVVAFWRRQKGRRDSMSLTNLGRCKRFWSATWGLSLVARRTGRIVGAVLCGHDGRRGYLHHLAVAESMRRQGLGRMLVERCLASLRPSRGSPSATFLFTPTTSRGTDSGIESALPGARTSRCCSGTPRGNVLPQDAGPGLLTADGGSVTSASSYTFRGSS